LIVREFVGSRRGSHFLLSDRAKLASEGDLKLKSRSRERLRGRQLRKETAILAKDEWMRLESAWLSIWRSSESEESLLKEMTSWEEYLLL